MERTTEQETIVVAAAPVSSTAVVIPTASMYWSAIAAGTIVTAGIWLLLHVLGLGVGLTAIDAEHPASLRGVGIGTGIWSIIAPLIALFTGGMVAGRIAGDMPRIAAVIHGAVLWSVATIVSMALMLSMLGSAIGSAARVSGQVVGATGAAAAQGADDFDLERLGLRESDLIAPINQRLRAAGKPEITADQLRAAARDALHTSVQQGRLDRDVFVQSLAARTPLDRQDAEELATTIERQWHQAVARGKGVGTAALEALDATGKALLGLFVLLGLGLAASAGGVTLAVARYRKRHGLARARVMPPRAP